MIPIIFIAIALRTAGPSMSIHQQQKAADQYLNSIGLHHEKCLKVHYFENGREFVYSNQEGQIFVVKTSKTAPYIASIDPFNPAIHSIRTKTKWE